MPNPQIQPLPPLRDREPPIPKRAIWKVYRLREQGEKLSKLALLNTEQVGVLSLWRVAERESLNARLTHLSGYPVLDNLYEVRVGRYDERGFLLRGVVMNSKGGKGLELPQTWWCVLESVNTTNQD